MVSRVGLVAIVLAVAAAGASGSNARTPTSGTAMFTAEADMRLCPSPLCGGYWVALANGVKTRCGNGERQARCYVSRAVDRTGMPLASAVPNGSLLRGAIELGESFGSRRLDQLVVRAAYSPAGEAEVGGGYYRVFDTRIVCIRAPCFSFRAQAVNGSSRITTSGVDLEASLATTAEIARARTALHTKDGLYARGRFAPTPDGGRTFRALRLYLRAPLLRA
jgi:Domain of unknown function (DUF6748)